MKTLCVEIKISYYSVCLIIFCCLPTIQPVHNSWTREVEVQTNLGKINGKRESFYGSIVDVFLGVPYAEPPIGQLRFQKPKAIKKYKNTIVAHTMPPACIQILDKSLEEYGISEDCLFLNIWSPTNVEPGLKSVIYWIYGESFLFGSIGNELYNGIALATFGNVIVVTVAYRVGPMGFLYLGTKDIPGNMGLYDILEGLKWVRNNIAAFGGNKNDITIAGQSAGAMSVGYLAVSPLARGLYHRAIMESGSPAFLHGEYNDRNLIYSKALAVAVNCTNNLDILNDTKDAECLKRADPILLTNLLFTFPKLTQRYFLPQFGDSILPTNARVSLANGQFHNTNLLIGNVKNEGSFQIVRGYEDLFGEFGEKDLNINKTFGEFRMRIFFSIFPNVSDFVKHYLGNLDEFDFEKVRRQTYTSFGDSTYVCPDVYTAEKYHQNGNRVFFYFFTHRPSVSPLATWMGVRHQDEVQFVFGQPILQSDRYTTEEVKLSKRMIRLWTDFAKTGYPSRYWPHYSKEEPKVFILDTQDIIDIGPHRDNCNFFRPYHGF